MDALVMSVVRLYEQGLPIARISKQLKVSEQKTRKILITTGVWSNDISRKIAALKEEGKSIEEIQKIVGMSRNAVLSYLPYDRGMKNAEFPTLNAIRIRESRERRKNNIILRRRKNKNADI